MDVSVRLASNSTEIDEARALCREWLEWHWTHYPADWPKEGNPMDPERFEATLENLPSLHARPNGAILVAYLKASPVGCVMYNEASPGVAQFNRMFVSEKGRGHGIGRRLLEQMFEQMIQDGYQRVQFSSAKFLTHAKSMYEAAGFQSVPAPENFPSEWKPYVYFMERPLIP